MVCKHEKAAELEKLKAEGAVLKERYLTANKEAGHSQLAAGFFSAVAAAAIAATAIPAIVGMAGGIAGYLIGASIVSGIAAAYFGNEALDRNSKQQNIKESWHDKKDAYRDKRLAEYNAHQIVHEIKHDNDLGQMFSQKNWEDTITQERQEHNPALPAASR